jgi:hypothetical protein
MAAGTQSGFFYWCDAKLSDLFVISLDWQETNYQGQGIEILLTAATKWGKLCLQKHFRWSKKKIAFNNLRKHTFA